MPAMSPTMTEGNIASWKVKEGDTFSPGDVLLEIETDKAQMDVEAQEDGIMAKITLPDGSKGVKVGTRIAVLADPGDDLSTLEVPPEDSAPSIAPKKSSSSDSSSSEGAPTPPPTPDSPLTPPPSSSSSQPPQSGSGLNQAYPLYPSVSQLLHENHIPSSDIPKIPASGPKGRLLKGDVLAYLHSIPSDYSSTQSARISKLGHLDLSNIKLAAPKPPPPPAPSGITPEQVVVAPPPATQVTLPISLTSVLTVQKRIQETLGTTIPLSTFLARAVDVANDDLPRSSADSLTADELFDQVIGLDTVRTIDGKPTSRGTFIPQITAVPNALPARAVPKRPVRETDIYDILTGKSSTVAKKVVVPARAAGQGSAAMNLFSVTVPRGEEKRARTFLERIKTVLQVEPGRLVL